MSSAPIALSAAARCASTARVWVSTAPARRLLLLAALVAAGQGAFAAWDVWMLDLPLVREEPASFGLSRIAQSLFLLFVSAALVRALVEARARPSPLDSRAAPALGLAAGIGSLAAGAAALALFLADPSAFHAAAQEDLPLEWASALLLLGASGILLFHAFSGRTQRAAAFCALALAAALFLIGMEEISWMQRVLGFSTPEQLAELNWQAEFNLHNVQTDLSETVYYFGAGAFLLLLPLLRDLLPPAAASHPLARLLPGRHVALASLPIAFLNYGHWNLFSVQLVTMVALFVCVAWAIAASGRGDARERMVFLLGAVAILAGQIAMILFGPNMTDLPDSTEYKEFFIALGLAVHAITVLGPGRKATPAG